jgi:hypothetical protein
VLSACLHFTSVSNNALAAPSCNVSTCSGLINAREVRSAKIICTAAARIRFLEEGLGDGGTGTTGSTSSGGGVTWAELKWELCLVVDTGYKIVSSASGSSSVSSGTSRVTALVTVSDSVYEGGTSDPAGIPVGGGGS